MRMNSGTLGSAERDEPTSLGGGSLSIERWSTCEALGAPAARTPLLGRGRTTPATGAEARRLELLGEVVAAAGPFACMSDAMTAVAALEDGAAAVAESDDGMVGGGVADVVGSTGWTCTIAGGSERGAGAADRRGGSVIEPEMVAAGGRVVGICGIEDMAAGAAATALAPAIGGGGGSDGRAGDAVYGGMAGSARAGGVGAAGNDDDDGGGGVVPDGTDDGADSDAADVGPETGGSGGTAGGGVARMPAGSGGSATIGGGTRAAKWPGGAMAGGAPAAMVCVRERMGDELPRLKARSSRARPPCTPAGGGGSAAGSAEALMGVGSCAPSGNGAEPSRRCVMMRRDSTRGVDDVRARAPPLLLLLLLLEEEVSSESLALEPAGASEELIALAAGRFVRYSRGCGATFVGVVVG